MIPDADTTHTIYNGPTQDTDAYGSFQGLTDARVQEIRRNCGWNVLTPVRQKSKWHQFLEKFNDPLIVVLMVAGVLSVGIAFYEYYGLGETWKVFFEPIGIFVAIALATTLAFFFEDRANSAFRILNRVDDDTSVEVIRNGQLTTVPRREIVVDDIVVLTTGAEVPADGQLLQAISLDMDESTMTGEQICHKTVDPEHFDSEATFPSNVVLRGTRVMSGHGVMRVTAVGDATEAGKVFEEAQIDSSVKTPLNRQLDQLAGWITAGSYTVAALVIVGQTLHTLGWGNWQSWVTALPIAVFFWLVIKKFHGWSRSRCGALIALFFALWLGFVAGAYAWINPGVNTADWMELMGHMLKTLMVAVTLIVVAVPEGLPMAVTLSLAFSMSRMLRTNNLVRKMHACETMGATTVICTDKTGTLTKNRMQLTEMKWQPSVDKADIYNALALNSTASLDQKDGKISVIGNPTEGALLMWLREQCEDYRKLRATSNEEAELPFDTDRKYMATVAVPAGGVRTLYVKGAPEIILGMCTDLTPEQRREIDTLLLAWQKQAMRTLAFAVRKLEKNDNGIHDNGITPGPLTFMGIVAIMDPVRDDVPNAVRQVRQAGIDVKVVTGDTAATAREIARRTGLWTAEDDNIPGRIITGEEFERMTDQQAAQAVRTLKIMSRARPLDKKRLVETLQKNGEVVAVTGDGTNDAPALKAAHVGLSMGDGTAVAKEASDITIMDNSFASIGRAVMWGRSLYRNIQRFLLFQLTVNVAACLLVMVGSFIGSESPLTVTQMLWVNLIMDTFGAMALASLPPSPAVMKMKPRSRKASIVTASMLKELVGVGVFFFALTIGFYWYFNHAEVPSLPAILHTAPGPAVPMTVYCATLLFSIFVWTHFWYMFNARAYGTGRSIFRLSMGGGFWTVVTVIVGGQLLITEVGYNFFNVTPMLHTTDWHFNPSGALDFVLIVALSSLVVWIREAWRLLRR